MLIPYNTASGALADQILECPGTTAARRAELGAPRIRYERKAAASRVVIAGIGGRRGIGVQPHRNASVSGRTRPKLSKSLRDIVWTFARKCF
jgi:hypothetical protein